MKTLYLLPLLFLSACINQEAPSNLRIVEVELMQVDYGFRSSAIIWIKDSEKGITTKQRISCDDWKEEDVLKQKIGQKYKVFEIGDDVRPSYYRLGESFC